MNELTPDMFARFASRLSSEIPGANLVPKSETQLSQPSPGAVDMPTDFGSLPANAVSPTVAAPPAPSAPTASSGPGSAAPGDVDGLRTFVQSIRSTNLGSTSSLGSAHPGQDDIQRLFTRKPAPTTVFPPATGLPTSVSSASPVSLGSFATTGARPLDVPAIRRDFPVLQQKIHGQPLAWLDNAATTQKPQSVIDAISSFYAHDNSNIHRGAHTLASRATDAFEQARQKVQAYLGASSAKEIVFVRGTTEAINLVAQTYGRKFLQPGDEIVLSTLEHHANIVPWQMIAKEKGAVLRVIPVTDRGEIMLEEYQALLGPRTRLVALAHASNALGTVLPVAEMTQMAKRFNARVLIDGAQSVAHIPVNMQQMGCDFFVFSGHKIFGPTGIGALYAKEELLEVMPPWQGGGSMIRNVTFEETTYSEAPAKFEAGTPNIADAIGLGAALDYVNRLGLPNIAKYEHGLLEYATEQLSRIDGLRLIGTAREKVSVLSFVLRDRPTEEIGRMLDQAGIAVRAGHHCAQPALRRFGLEATVRPSFSLYNTPDEVDRLADAIKRIQSR